MCGILAVISAKEIVLEKCLSALHKLQHRGPDSSGYYTEDTIFLGHKRLAIVDVQHGQQPLYSENRQIIAVVNGAFYNYRSIRNQLQQKGHVFKTQSDSEILIHLYEDYGVNCLEYLEGEFAFVLWDAHRQQLFAARDRFGVKPLFYANEQHQLILASEMKAITAMGIASEWNLKALQSVFSSQYLPKDACLIKGIQPLQAGHYLLYSNRTLKMQQYWDIPPLQANKKQASAEQLASLMHRAVQKRLDCAVPVACHLSGGIDSATIAALMAQQSSAAIDCFSVIFEGSVYNESKLAQEQAAYIGATLHEVPVDSQSLLQYYEEAVYYSESLAINGQLVAKHMLNKAVAEHGYKVVLGGEGADEVLFGYPFLKQDYYGQQSAVVAAQQTTLKGIMLDDVDAADYADIQQQLGYVPTFLAAKLQLGHRIKSVLNADIDLVNGSQLFLNQYAKHYNSKMETSRYMWTKSAFATYILNGIGDGTEMANSVEGRLPFLDKAVVEFATHLHGEDLYNQQLEKIILRKAMQGLVVDNIRNKAKHPFIAPPLSLQPNAQGYDWIMDMMHSDNFRSIPYINVAKSIQFIQSLPQASAAEKIKKDAVVHILLSLGLFSKHFNMH